MKITKSRSRTRFFLFILTAMALLTLARGVSALGIVTSYTSAATFSLATTGVTSYSFPQPAMGSGEMVASPYMVGPLSFSASLLLLENDGLYGSGMHYLAAVNSDEGVSLAGATAVSFTLGTYAAAQSLSIYVNGTLAAVVAEAGHPNTMFIGFTDTVPITSLTFKDTTSPGGEIDATGFQVGMAVPGAPVPESSSTWALLALALPALFGFRRRLSFSR